MKAIRYVVVFLVGAAIVGAVLRPFLVSPSYESTCVIGTGSEAARLLGEDDGAGEPTDGLAAVTEGMLRYGRVMAALADTELMKALAERAEAGPTPKSVLEERLHHRIVVNTRFKALGPGLVEVSYTAESPAEAVTVLHKLTTHFIENALMKDRTFARGARKLALMRLTFASATLEGAESKVQRFREEHPGVGVSGEVGPRARLAGTFKELRKVDREIVLNQSRSDRYKKTIEKMPKAEGLREKVSDLKDTIDMQMEYRRRLELRATMLEERVATLPALEMELRRLMRGRRYAEEDYDPARKVFRRLDRRYRIVLEGLVPFSILSPPRRPVK